MLDIEIFKVAKWLSTSLKVIVNNAIRYSTYGIPLQCLRVSCTVQYNYQYLVNWHFLAYMTTYNL